MRTKVILITGCSSGIGYDAAMKLFHRGHHVIAACRKPSDVEKLSSQGIDAVCMDMDDTASIESAVTTVLEKTKGRIDVLINNAGYGQAGALEDITREVLRAQFETNVFGLMELTRRVVPIMRKQGYGRVINIGSILGRVGMPFRGAYCASKFAVEGLNETLRMELKPAGIQVIIFNPGPIQSQFTNTVLEKTFNSIDRQHSRFSNQYKQMLGSFSQKKSSSWFTKGPEVVVQKLIHAIESPRPKGRYTVTLAAHLLAISKQMLSIRLLDKLIIYITGKRWDSE